MTDFTLKSLLQEMVTNRASDLYLSIGSSPMFRIEDDMVSHGDANLTESKIFELIGEVLNKPMLDEFNNSSELNSAIHVEGVGRFRINLYKQQLKPGAVIRRVRDDIPSMDELRLPAVLKDFAMLKRGLILVAGQTGSGKTTTAASILDHRNANSTGHIITVEDPVEFLHSPKKCLFTQREVGIDTDSFTAALKNALRQRPDVVFIGEIRDREAMEHAIRFAETGHLCISTIHATDTPQVLERAANLFSGYNQKQVLFALSNMLKGVVAQRLVQTKDNSKVVATEVLINQGYITTLIQEASYREIKDMLAKSTDQGMHTFDQSLMTLYKDGVISEEAAISEADNPINMKVNLRLNSGDKPAVSLFEAKHKSVF